VKEPHSEWKEVDAAAPGARAWINRKDGLYVLRSLSTTKDGEKWVHISISTPDRVPNWEEISRVKACFLGLEVEAYQVLPKQDDYVNVCTHCLHIWAPLDGKRRVANLMDLVNEEAV
jgi:hypothetical protein